MYNSVNMRCRTSQALSNSSSGTVHRTFADNENGYKMVPASNTSALVAHSHDDNTVVALTVMKPFFLQNISLGVAYTCTKKGS